MGQLSPRSWSLSSPIREASSVRSLRTPVREEPPLSATRESPRSNKDPVQLKKYLYILNKLKKKKTTLTTRKSVRFSSSWHLPALSLLLPPNLLQVWHMLSPHPPVPPAKPCPWLLAPPFKQCRLHPLPDGWSQKAWPSLFLNF